MTFIKRYFNKKAQGIIEYAIMLAFVVGLGVTLQGVGIKDNVVSVFDSVATMLAGGSENKYAAGLELWGNISYDKLLTESKSERIAADLSGLTNIANYLNSLDLTFEELAGNNQDNNSYLKERWVNRTNLGTNPDNEVVGSVILNYWGKGGVDSNQLCGLSSYSAVNWMQQINDTNYISSTTASDWPNQRYFYSDEMNVNGQQRQIKVAFTRDDSGNVTGTKVWVSNLNGGASAITAQDSNGNDVTYSVYVPKS